MWKINFLAMFHRSYGLVLTDNAAPPSFRSHILFQKIKLADKMVNIQKSLLNKDKQQQPQILKHYHQYIKKERPYNCHEVYIYITVKCPVTFVLERWLGSSLDCSAPAPSVGSWVWNTVTRPPVGDMSLKAACSAGPRALWVSLLWLNMVGSDVSRSFTSCMREGGKNKRQWGGD